MPPGWSLNLRANYLRVNSERLRGGFCTAELNRVSPLSPNMSTDSGRTRLGRREVQYKVDGKSASDLIGRFEYRSACPQPILEAGFSSGFLKRILDADF